MQTLNNQKKIIIIVVQEIMSSDAKNAVDAEGKDKDEEIKKLEEEKKLIDEQIQKLIREKTEDTAVTKNWCIYSKGQPCSRFYDPTPAVRCMCSMMDRSPTDWLRFEAARKLKTGQSTNILLEDGVREWIYRLPDRKETADAVRYFFVGTSDNDGIGTGSPLILFADRKMATYQIQQQASMALRETDIWKEAESVYAKLNSGLRTTLLVEDRKRMVRNGGKIQRLTVDQWTQRTGWALLDYGCPQHAKLAASGSKFTKQEFISLAQYAHTHGITAKRIEHVCNY